MKRMSVLAVMIGLAAFGARGQTNVTTTGGTPGNLAKFTGSSAIGNSAVVENNGNIGIGTANPLFPLVVTNGSGFDPFPGEVFVETEGSDQFTAAIRALAGRQTNNLTFAIDGVTFNPAGIGVQGNYSVTDVGQGGGGVHGQSSATAGFSYGVSGDALGTSGVGIGVWGRTSSPDGDAGRFTNAAHGTLLRGQVGPGGSEVTVFRVDGNGTVHADGGFRPFGADFAESLEVKGSSEQYSPGDVLVIDPSGLRRMTESQTSYSTLVAGIYSTKPGVVASQHRVDEALPNNEVPLAVVGIVPCKVTTENGPIMAGDLLVTSSTPGHAMKGTERPRMLGAVVGKALEPLKEGIGVIQVLVTLQ
jgi:hypothetical protein